MKKDKLMAISILPIMWFAYFIFEVVTGRINDSYTVLMNIFTGIIFALVGLVIYEIGSKYKEGLRSRTLWILFFIIFILDQGLKLIIKMYYFNTTFTLINNFLYFSPIINSQGSWLNARFGAGVSFNLLVILNIIALILFVEIYRYFNSRNPKSYWLDLCFVFALAGCLCSLIDKVFYGGSLDFIGISDLFIADFKDIYINISILFLFLGIYIGGYLSNDKENTFKEDIVEAKKFLSFVLKDLKLKK